MEVSLSAGCRMPGGTSSGNDGFQDAAGTLGKGIDPGLKENTPQGFCQRCFPASQNRSMVSLDGQLELSADDRPVSFAHARHDHPLLSGMVPDALHRLASLHGIDALHFQFLSRLAKGTVYKEFG